jgi:murein DD-endopeptidase MepM/ murein hydrolase activator NlpD
VSRLPRLLVSVAVLALVPTVAFAQTGELRDRLADTADERTRAQEELDEVRAAEMAARDRLAAAEEQLGAAEAGLAELETELEAAQERLAQARAAAEAARSRLAEVDARLAAADDELVEKRARLEARVRAAYKYGHVSFAEAFLGVHDIADFISSSTFVGHVLEGDRELVEDVTRLLAEIEEQRAEAQELRIAAEQEARAIETATTEVEQATEEQARLLVLVREQRAEQRAALEALREDRASIEGHLAGLEAESNRIEEQLAAIARQQAEEARRVEEARRAEEERRARESRERAAAGQPPLAEEAGGDLGESVGGWTRPVGGRLTSPFGPRWGRNHNGVDLAGSVGTGVVASRDGTVVHVTNVCHPTSSWGCGGGFGNYVTIVHPGGMATIYAHLSTVGVGMGQGVAAGQSIGAVGNSGNSYGAHLHFEVRDSGVPRDPCRYIAC